MSYCILDGRPRRSGDGAISARQGAGSTFSLGEFLKGETRFSFVWMHLNDIVDYRIPDEQQHALKDRIATDGSKLLFFTRDIVGVPGVFLGEPVMVHAWAVASQFLDCPDAIPAVALLEALTILCEAFLLAAPAHECGAILRRPEFRTSLNKALLRRLRFVRKDSCSPLYVRREENRQIVDQPCWWRRVLDPDGTGGDAMTIRQLELGVGRLGVKGPLASLVRAIFAEQALTVEQVAAAYVRLSGLRSG